jgi:hypothetical protein
MTAPAFTVWERRTTSPMLVFELVDRFLRDRGTVGPDPRIRGPVRYRIVALESATVRTELPHALDMVMVRNADGIDLWFGMVVPGGPPTIRYRPEPGVSAVVEIVTDRYQRVETVIALPAGRGERQRFVLEPGWTYDFPDATSVPGGTGPTMLRGTLRRSDGAGIGGARIRIDPPPPDQPSPTPEYLTDSSGNWVLWFDDAVISTDTAELEITLTDAAPLRVAEVAIVRGDTSALRQASVSGVTCDRRGRPSPGARVTVDAAPGVSTRSDADGRWELWLPVELLLPSEGPQRVTLTATPGAGGPSVSRDVDLRPRATTWVDPLLFP